MNIIAWNCIAPRRKEWICLGDNVTFLESSGGNEEYDRFRNDGKSKIYIAVQIECRYTAIKCISWDKNENKSTKSSVKVEDIIPQVRLPDGTEKMTIYGCKVSNTGMFWMCAFDSNLVLCYDLNVKPIPTLKYQVQVPAPNDLCISTTDERVIYVAGGLTSNFDSSILRSIFIKTSNIPIFGEIYKIHSGRFIPPIAEIVIPDLHTLSGIYCTANYIYFTELYTLRRIPISACKQPRQQRRALVEDLWMSSWSTDIDNEGNRYN